MLKEAETKIHEEDDAQKPSAYFDGVAPARSANLIDDKIENDAGDENGETTKKVSKKEGNKNA